MATRAGDGSWSCGARGTNGPGSPPRRGAAPRPCAGGWPGPSTESHASSAWMGRTMDEPIRPGCPTTEPDSSAAAAPAQHVPTPEPGWPVLEGYDVLEVRGRGGMGVVYRALDRRRGTTVALKTMQQFDASSLYRFKQEFRTLRDVSHPNLVTLHELVSDGRNWFITMEFVDGVDFLSHVRAWGGPA